MGFPRQEYWSRLPFPTPGDLLDPRDRTCISCLSCITGGFFTSEPSGKPVVSLLSQVNCKHWASLVVHAVKNLPTVRETWV